MLSTGQVAERLQVSPNTVKKWWREGRLRGVQLSPRKLRFHERDVREFLRAVPPSLARPVPVYRAEEIAWRQSHRETLQHLKGQWAVVDGSRLVAHDADPAVAVKAARRQGVAVPYVFFVNWDHEPSESWQLGLTPRAVKQSLMSALPE